MIICPPPGYTIDIQADGVPEDQHEARHGFGVVTANLAAFFIESNDDEVTVQLRTINERLQRMEALLAAGRDGK